MEHCHCSFDEHMARFKGDEDKVWPKLKKEYLEAKMLKPVEVSLRGLDEAVDTAVYGLAALSVGLEKVKERNCAMHASLWVSDAPLPPHTHQPRKLTHLLCLPAFTSRQCYKRVLTSSVNGRWPLICDPTGRASKVGQAFAQPIRPHISKNIVCQLVLQILLRNVFIGRRPT